MLFQQAARMPELDELAARYAHRVAHNISAADLYSDDGAFIMRTPGQPVMEIRGRAELDKGHDGLLDEAAPAFERALLEIALEATKGQRIEAAKRLGWGRNTLTRKIKELGLGDDE